MGGEKPKNKGSPRHYNYYIVVTRNKPEKGISITYC